MAKTIKEMAHDHVVAYMHNGEYEEMEDTFIAGANAVLDAVRKCTSYEEFKKVISELEDYR